MMRNPLLLCAGAVLQRDYDLWESKAIFSLIRDEPTTELSKRIPKDLFSKKCYELATKAKPLVEEILKATEVSDRDKIKDIVKEQIANQDEQTIATACLYLGLQSRWMTDIKRYAVLMHAMAVMLLAINDPYMKIVASVPGPDILKAYAWDKKPLVELVKHTGDPLLRCVYENAIGEVI